MKTENKDVFFKILSENLGIPEDKIVLKLTDELGEITCGGPKPERFPKLPGSEQFRELPWELEYCITVTLETPPPRFLCEAYRQEYKQLLLQLETLFSAEEWAELAIVSQRLAELKAMLSDFCKNKTRSITYCIFPTT